jgi:hypothetical protein
MIRQNALNINVSMWVEIVNNVPVGSLVAPIIVDFFSKAFVKRELSIKMESFGI